MPSKLRTVTSVEQLRRTVREWRGQGLRSAVVPTMGALHDGHLTLVRQALRQADRVVVTIFVNPKQFGAGEDLARYPRREREDVERLREAGAHLVFMPQGLEMYPEGFATTVSVAGPARVGLEDRFRPHFFDGVATVVAKLFIQCGCDYAMFGEKDYQQLKVVTRMAGDLNIALSVIGVATVREPDGLAMSSRNQYLSPAERRRAALIHDSLQAAAARIRAGMAPGRAAGIASRALTRAGFRVDYVAAREAETLEPPKPGAHRIRLLAAAWLGSTRLIDNIAV